MSALAQEVGTGFFGMLETRLARLLGLYRWPAVEAKTDSTRVPVNLASYEAFTFFVIFGYTVQGTPYATTLRASKVRPRARFAADRSTILQYHPRHPGWVYYAPQQYLARFVVVFPAMLLLSGLVALTITLVVR